MTKRAYKILRQIREQGTVSGTTFQATLDDSERISFRYLSNNNYFDMVPIKERLPHNRDNPDAPKVLTTDNKVTLSENGLQQLEDYEDKIKDHCITRALAVLAIIISIVALLLK